MVHWVVTSQLVRDHLVVRVPEIDVSHILSIKEHIWEIGVIVPEIVLVVLPDPVLSDLVVEHSSHTEADVGVDYRFDSVEIGIEGTQ